MRVALKSCGKRSLSVIISYLSIWEMTSTSTRCFKLQVKRPKLQIQKRCLTVLGGILLMVLKTVGLMRAHTTSTKGSSRITKRPLVNLIGPMVTTDCVPLTVELLSISKYQSPQFVKKTPTLSSLCGRDTSLHRVWIHAASR